MYIICVCILHSECESFHIVKQQSQGSRLKFTVCITPGCPRVRLRPLPPTRHHLYNRSSQIAVAQSFNAYTRIHIHIWRAKVLKPDLFARWAPTTHEFWHRGKTARMYPFLQDSTITLRINEALNLLRVVC